MQPLICARSMGLPRSPPNAALRRSKFPTFFPHIFDLEQAAHNQAYCDDFLARLAKKLERRKNLYFTRRSSLLERRVGATGSKAASAILDLSIAARRIAESEFRIEPWACDHAAS